jgi:hypothetical protein
VVESGVPVPAVFAYVAMAMAWFCPAGTETPSVHVSVPPLLVQPGELDVSAKVCAGPPAGVTETDCVAGET